MTTAQLQTQIRRRLEAAYGERLQAVVLHGSEARGDAKPDSDIDLLVVLDGPVAVGRELHTIIDALYPLTLETGRVIDAQPVDRALYEAGEYSLYRHAKREGIAL